MKTNNNKTLACTANQANTSTSASNPNLQSASSNNTSTFTQAPSMQSSSTNVSVCSNQGKDIPQLKHHAMSVSMTSLPSPQHNTNTTFSTLLQQSTDMSAAANEFLSPNKIVIDRAYNSLKKKRDVEVEMWRRSWGSGHSHSSCSLQSSATNATGSGTGKDDFWAALQTNYNFIMDTHLLESCKEARGEIEGNIVPNVQESDCCKKLKNQSSRSHGPGLSDPRRLRRWLREMESRMEKVPTLSEGRKLKTAEIQKLLRDHTELHREIVSQARAVAASIRASEKDNIKQNLSNSSSSASAENESENSPSPSNSSKNKDEPPINALERRYHLLYLKAIEVQCLLENLLERKQSPTPSTSSSSSSENDEPAAKHVRLTGAFSDVQSDDDWIALRHKNVLTDISNTDAFEADSEGSDNDQLLKIAISSTTSTNSDGPPTIMSPHFKFVTDKMEKDINTTETDNIDISIGQSTTTSVTHTTTVSSPQFDSPKLCTVKKRPKKTDPAAKFNRSNRKSKNCGTFYFKHADTDNEGNHTNVTTTDGGEETGTEDEQWIFTTGEVDDENNPIDEDDEQEQNEEKKIPNFKRHLSFTDDGIIESHSETHSNLVEVATSTVTGAVTETNFVQESGHTSKISYICVTKATKESIQKLVLGAESLVRDEVIMKAQNFQASVSGRMSHATATIHKQESLLQSPKIRRVQEWLEHQPISMSGNVMPVTGLLSTDCEASGEASDDTDEDIRQEDSDTSNSLGVTDSQVTFMRHDSQATSVDNCLGASSGDLLTNSSGKETSSTSNTTKSQTIELRMNSKRATNRPWSVSCISQLETAVPLTSSNQDSNFSISESALDTISLPNMPAGGVKSEESTPVHKRTLRKRRIRNRKRAVRKLDANIAVQVALGNLVTNERQVEVHENIMTQSIDLSSVDTPKCNEEEEEDDVVKPDFKIGSVTKVYAQTLGPLAALSRYNLGDTPIKESPDMPDSSQRSGTEELSSFEQMWDNYQEKYMSEPYSEDRDTDAAKRLLEFGDDYRNFLDSQSDACSSLSAAQGLDSISPPRHRRFIGGAQTPSDKGDSSLEVKKRRLLELSEFERRRKNLNKMYDEGRKSLDCAPINEDEDRASLPKMSPEKGNRKESDSSIRRRSLRQRKSASSSSADSDSDNDQDICNLLSQSRSRVENVEALRVRHHLLRPEDYAEIIATCTENIKCLETVLKGPSNSGNHHLLSAVRAQQARELLSIWESLLDWSENTSVIRQLQEEIDVLKGSLLRLGSQSYCFDSEESIEQAIEDLKNERTRLAYYRSKMLKINASVQRWITHQETRMAKEKEIQQKMGEEQKKEKEVKLADDEQFHEQLKESITEMYGIWDQTDERLTRRLDDLESALQTWQQFESGLNELKETLDKDRGAIFGFKGALEAGSAIPSEFVSNAEAIAKLLQVNPDNDLKDILAENPLLPPAILQYGIRPPSAGCSSDSGISDDGGLSERERRLGTLRRLAKQLESDLTPGSDALKTIADRMRSAEAELRTLQETCRDLILKTTASHNQFIESMNKNARSPINVQIPIIAFGKQKAKGKKKNRGKRSPQNSLVAGADFDVEELTDETDGAAVVAAAVPSTQSSCWMKFFKYAVPIQLALLAFLLAMYGLEPHSCDRMNNFQNSFNPQLRYVRGPPPI
ncbi:klarsicht protein [Culicoides brevitarsis]|uniref:klarsicht protein n=1 Tax=Culicoides brevitarsis TaxID=469753 RepID=UPI00307C593F